MKPGAAAFVLAVAAASAGAAGLPDVAGVQAAYEAARSAVDAASHANDLVIQSARCQPLSPGRQAAAQAACQIDFVRRLEPEGRLYFEIVTLEARNSGAWELLSGLCKTRPPVAHPGRSRAI